MIIERKKKELEKVIFNQAKNGIEEEYNSLKLNLASSHRQKLDDFMESEEYSDINFDDIHSKNKIACEIFGLSHL